VKYYPALLLGSWVMIATSCIRRRHGHRLIDAAIRSDVLRLLNLADNQGTTAPGSGGGLANCAKAERDDLLDDAD
jgi:hypothetical protein